MSAAGYRRTRRNTQMVMRTAASMFLGRAPLFIEHGSPARPGGSCGGTYSASR